MLKSILFRNLLSFGPNETNLELGPLNVLIGPNGCGKSNVLEAMYLLSRLPAAGPEVSLPIIDWIWKGSAVDAIARIEVVLEGIDLTRAPCLRHRLDFRSAAQRFTVEDELIEASQKTDHRAQRPFFYFHYEHGRAWFAGVESDRNPKRSLRREDLDPERSVLAQRNDPDEYPEIAHIRADYEGIRAYRDINFGPKSPTRQPQRTDLPSRALLEDGSNIGLILNRLRAHRESRTRLEDLLRRFYPSAEAVDVRIEGGTVQIYLTENQWITPATRLSDGTMRWLALLAILLDPSPPKVVCLDEPDLGLHPDIIPALSDLLQEASKRMQIIVTTHSDELVDALSDQPESIVVCEKQDGATTLNRLNRANLQVWLEKYQLGELWNSGQIGGRRF
ncbi:MAG: AAA family ATPase [Phycisphaerales bacterium]|nr:AAA family ATPase [Phycisphaerales bacterium]